MAFLVLLLISDAHAQSPSFSSSDIADAAERITAKRAHMNDDIRLLAGDRLEGPAITMHAVRDDQASAMEEGLKAIKILEAASPRSVIVLVLEGDKSFAVFGATFATLADSRGLGGFVVDGSMRGLTEFRKLSMPLFAVGTVSGSAGGHYRLQAINVPVVCGGVEVAPGDLIVGDADGVAVAPKNRSPEIIAMAKQLRREKDSLLPLVAKYRSYTTAVQEQKTIRNRKAAKKTPR